jgi:hypothetical protein
MIQSFARFHVLVVAAAVILCANAGYGGTISSVTNLNSVTIPAGAELVINFGTWTYAANNPGYSPDPTVLSFEAYGAPIAGPVLAVPNSSAQYFSGYQFSGYLESADGSVIAPLNDPDASKSGYGAGTLLVTPGRYSGPDGTAPVSVLSASITLSQSVSQTLFGTYVATPWMSSAKIVLKNTGPDFILGLGGNTPIGSLVQESGLHGAGPVDTAGVTLSVVLDRSGTAANAVSLNPILLNSILVNPILVNPVPEPRPALLLAGGLLLMLATAYLKLRQG